MKTKPHSKISDQYPAAAKVGVCGGVSPIHNRKFSVIVSKKAKIFEKFYILSEKFFYIPPYIPQYLDLRAATVNINKIKEMKF